LIGLANGAAFTGPEAPNAVNGAGAGVSSTRANAGLAVSIRRQRAPFYFVEFGSQ
jgi:hypothetical protein